MSSLVNKYDTLEQIIIRDGLRIKAIHLHKDLDLMLIVLNNGKILRRAISSSKLLKKATEKQLNDYRLIGKGAGIHWPQLDEDLSLKGFLQEELSRVIAA
ncbi:hypothetical protein BH23BAC1_BH23BAC1_36720 [soil metagenome]